MSTTDARGYARCVMARSLRVLHITKRFWPYQGGVERYVLDLAAAQARLGRSCRVLTIDRDLVVRGDSRLPAVERHEGIEIHRVKAFGGSRKQFVSEPPDRILRLLRWADVIHHHDPRFLFETVVFTRPVFRRPVVFHTHGMILHTPAHLRLKKLAMRRYYGPMLARGVDAVIASSGADAEMMTTYCGLGPETVRVFENGLDLTRYRSIVRQREPGSLLCFGRIDRHKGLARLLDLVSRVEGRWRLDIAGVGPDDQMDDLRRRCEDLGLSDRVSWLGHVEDAELDSLLAKCDVVAFPSEFEGFGLALVEALAAGCLVVASDIPPHREVLGPGLADRLTTFEIPDGVQDLRRALALTEAQRDELEARARARAEAFSVGRLVAEIDGLYAELGLTAA